jgi:hypothetical protein
VYEGKTSFVSVSFYYKDFLILFYFPDVLIGVKATTLSSERAGQVKLLTVESIHPAQSEYPKNGKQPLSRATLDVYNISLEQVFIEIFLPK